MPIYRNASTKDPGIFLGDINTEEAPIQTKQTVIAAAIAALVSTVTGKAVEKLIQLKQPEKQEDQLTLTSSPKVTIRISKDFAKELGATATKSEQTPVKEAITQLKNIESESK